ncbi:MAG: acetyl-CoA carboxylase biotin carboxyl carrier protein subunit [Candidatus Kapabacteria bacterium]|nr:acetyl-CoA carboxylase biotin carboxyl carrier protein subunit [Ignavibacteriota bacterium]MCW5884081.1 acetyl-CoA carboxylase biotin carboxyl carrier protein subunit [Candidatus Kapabacteria bacterium]
MILRFQDKKYKIETSQNYSRILKAEIDGWDGVLRIAKYDEDNNYLPLGNESDYYAYAAKDDKHIYVMYEGVQYIFDIMPDEAFFIDESEVNDDSHEHIKAPMPGSIVKILVNEGDTVEEGAPIIIIEAMKMETKLYASISGIIKQINCKVGEQVDSDLVIVEIVKE